MVLSYEVFDAVEWQAPFMAQPAHPQPQDDFPFLLLRTILTITVAITIIRTTLMIIVAKFSMIHVPINILLFLSTRYYIRTTDEICYAYRANRSHKAAYFLSKKLSYKIFQIVVVRITLY